MKKLTRAQQHARRLCASLAELYPDASCALNHANPLQLLVATILSAQCTDIRVNLVTPALFARYPTVNDYATADLAELEGYVQSTGFYRNKAKNIQACGKRLLERHNGQVPSTLEELVQLPGVGRKTANVVLSEVFHTPAVTVDTHVGRLSRRLGLTTHSDPEKVEQDIMQLLPAEMWNDFNHRMIFHGRQVCHARKPSCGTCTLRSFCPQVGVTTSTT